MKAKPDIEQFATLDFEASSLSEDSWPIEVGLSWLEAGKVRTWSRLIRPSSEWKLADWSPHSAVVHGIPLEYLEDAPDACKVAKELLAQLGSRTLVSDAPEFESRWLSRRMKAALMDVTAAVEDYHRVSFANFSGLALDMLYESLERRPAPHRAGPDSARLAHGWRTALKYSA